MSDAAKPLDVIVAGELFVDLILGGFEFWPQPGQEAFAREFHREAGGGAAITASGLAALGSRTGLFGVVGADWGPWLVGRMRRAGVETSPVLFHPDEPTAFTVAVTTPRDRAFFTYPGANRRFAPALSEAAAAQQFAQARHLHLACAPELDSAVELLAALRRNGCSLSLDVGWHEDWLGDSRAFAIVRLVDIFFPNELEAQKITGENASEAALRRFAAEGVNRVALKLGSCGAALLWDGEIVRATPHPVVPLDTTGAGDCFDAGFLHAWLHGETPAACLAAANICGALSTEAYGGIAGFPDAARIARELKGHTCEK